MLKSALIAVGLIDDCPTNPRQFYNEQRLMELAQSMAVDGLQQAITVRPHPTNRGRFEAVMGHRRLRAARHLGWEKIDAVLRDLDDRETLEAQLAENRDRENLHPMEEARAYHRLQEEFGEPVDVIAEKSGQSAATVARRLNLVHLRDEVQTAYLADEISTGVAELLARIPGVLQLEAMKATANCSAADAKRVIESRYMLRLDDAPFDTGDATLGDVVPCVLCDRRTGNAPDLFGDVEGPDVCTDPPCYAVKVDVWWARQAAAAEANGHRILTDAETKKWIQHGHVSSKSPYASLTDRCVDDPKGRTYGQLIAADHPITLARIDNKVMRLVRRAELGDALAAAGHDFTKAVAKRERAETRDDAVVARDKERARLRRTVVETTIAAVVSQAEVITNSEVAEKLWRLTARHLIAAHESAAADIARRREVPVGKRERESDALQRQLPDMGLTVLRGLIIEIVATRFAYSNGSDALDDYCTLFSIDREVIESVARDIAATKPAEE